MFYFRVTLHREVRLVVRDLNQDSTCHLKTSGVMLLDLHNPLKLARELKPHRHMMEEIGAAYMANGLTTLARSRMYT
jgi:glutamate-1-semialdehyde 2,1-aminomutase